MDLRKLKDRASTWYKKGKFERALEAYFTLIREEPDNPRWSLKAGETYKKLGDNRRAGEAFHIAARGYADQGFDLKAIAMCNLILDLQPEDAGARSMLEEIRSSRLASRQPPPVEIEAEPPPPLKRPKRPTIPPGGSLDAARLQELVPEARRLEPVRPAKNDVFVIPLDEELDAAFDDAFASRAVEQPEPAPELPPTPLFSSLDADSLRSIVEKATVRHFNAGEKIITEGEPGDSLFVLVEGEVAVYREGPPRIDLNRLAEGAFFGEIAVITKFTRTCTVEARCESTVLEISTDVIGQLIDEHPAVLKVLLKFFRDRLVDTLIETSPLFTTFAKGDRRPLASRFAFLEADPGTELLTAGEEADGLYVLLSGELEVNPGLVPLRPGEIFGETSLLTEAPAPYGVTAHSKCWVLRLERGAFREVIMTHPQVLAFVAEVSERRQAAQLPLI